MVYRIYVEKKPALANEARALYSELVNLLGIRSLTGVRVLNRYDAEHISKELFDEAVGTVFSEPQLDIATEELDARGGTVFAVDDSRNAIAGSEGYRLLLFLALFLLRLAE